MDKQMTDNRTRFVELLRSTKRKGIENVVNSLDNLGFFKAPASTRFHLNYEGGLMVHSLNVCDIALELRELMLLKKPELKDDLPRDSVIISALLHDVCKADVYKPTIKKEKNALGVWVPAKGYDIDYTNFPLGHGEKSVFVLMKSGFHLIDDEIAAIRWHMHAWDLPFQSYELINNLNAAKNKYPLLNLIQAADGLAAHLMER